MTHSNGVEDKDVGGEYGGSVPTARYTRRFTLNLSDHTKRDAFDEFSYIELLNSELVSKKQAAGIMQTIKHSLFIGCAARCCT